MASVDTVAVDKASLEAKCHPAIGRRHAGRRFRHYQLIVILFTAAIYFATVFSPPSLMDDVDAVQAQISRNMLESGDWVTPHLNGIAYLEKAPLKYWTIAVSFAIFGVHDWSARLPVVLFTILLCWAAARIGAWAFGERTGLYCGLVMSTCLGLWLFTRILLPDAMLTLSVALALWGFARALDRDEPHPGRWAHVAGACVGIGLLLKGLIAAVFPIGTAIIYLACTRQLFRRETWRRLHIFTAALLALAIAAPWHVLATLRNPPYFEFTMHSGPGQYHGFFWFYFINEHLLRFLNLRYPRDYNTVPRLWFWLLHFAWLFPWSVFLPKVTRLRFRGDDRASRMRLLALCWIACVLVFFTFSSTQEYYSMPAYPAFALLLGCAVAAGGRAVKIGRQVLAGIVGAAAVVIATILVCIWDVPTPGDIARALAQHPSAYTLSLGHMGDLTLESFAYLRAPLIVAGAAFAAGAAGLLMLRGRRAWFAAAGMMVVFFVGARLALIAFDPYMSSRPLAAALVKSPPGQLIEDDAYYTFSSVFFYTNRSALLLNGRKTNLEYGSNAPGAPDVFIDDARLAQLWPQQQRYYLLVEGPKLPRIERAVGPSAVHIVAASGGKFLLTNLPF